MTSKQVQWIKRDRSVSKDVMHACEIAMQRDLRLSIINHVDGRLYGTRECPVAWNSDPENLSYPPQAPVIL
jgi:hypothetical protein